MSFRKVYWSLSLVRFLGLVMANISRLPSCSIPWPPLNDFLILALKLALDFLKDSLTATPALAISFLFLHEMYEQMAKTARAMPTIVPVEMAAPPSVKLKSPMLKSFLSYQGSTLLWTSPSQLTTCVLLPVMSMVSGGSDLPPPPLASALLELVFVSFLTLTEISGVTFSCSLICYFEGFFTFWPGRTITVTRLSFL